MNTFSTVCGICRAGLAPLLTIYTDNHSVNTANALAHKAALSLAFRSLSIKKHISGSAGLVWPTLYQPPHVSVHQTCIRMEKKPSEMSSRSIFTHGGGTSCLSRGHSYIQSSWPTPAGLSRPSVTSGAAAQPCHSLRSPSLHPSLVLAMVPLGSLTVSHHR